MKKTVLLVVLALMLVSAGAWAKQKDIGIGVEFVSGYGLGYGGGSALGGVAITGSPPVLPLVFGVNFDFIGAFKLGITGDWWLVQRPIAGNFAWYAGPGLWGTFHIGGGYTYVGFGARGVAAIQWFPIEVLEVFAEVGVNIGVGIGTGGAGLALGVPVAVGARFWF